MSKYGRVSIPLTKKERDNRSIYMMAMNERRNRLFENSTDRMKDGRAVHDIKAGVRTLKLSITILAHLFYVDDSKIDFVEKALFNKTLNAITEFNVQDKMEMRRLLTVSVDEDFVLNYINGGNFQKSEVESAIEYLRNDVKLYGNDMGRLLNFKKHYESKSRLDQ